MNRCLAVIALLTSLSWSEPRPLSLLIPGLNLRTSFAHDYGDMLDSIHYQGREYRPHEACKPVLTAAGWKGREDKLLLGEAWAREVVLHGSELVTEKNLRGLPRDYAARAELLADGTFRYTATAISMRGRNPGSSSARYQIEISPEAELKVTRLSASDEGRLDPFR